MNWFKKWFGEKESINLHDGLAEYLQEHKGERGNPIAILTIDTKEEIRKELKKEFAKDHSYDILPLQEYIADSQFRKPWLKNEVRDYLKTSMECRESDEVLCAAIWRSQINKMQGMNLYSFISLYEHKKVATAGSITRVRRLLQEQNPELRGSNWTKRHEQEQTVREEARAAKWTEGMKPTEGA